MDQLVRLRGMAILPSPPDERDYTVDLVSAPVLPEQVSLPDSPIILDQGQSPFCGGASGAGIANAYYNSLGKMPKNGFSMTFIYWLAKQYDGMPNVQGTYLRTILKVMNKYGCAPEDLQPFSLVNHPKINAEAFKVALDYKVQSYYKLSTPYEMKIALTSGFYILLATFITRDNWSYRNKGWISGPSGEFAGGHATRGNGYDNNLRSNIHDHIGYFICSNSWGIRWGDDGKFYLPYDYFNFKVPNIGYSKFIEAWAVEFTPPQLNKDTDTTKFNYVTRRRSQMFKPDYKKVRGII